MSNQSNIEWTEMTWNPIVGCTKISPGCKHCYAETMAARLQAMGTPGYENGFSINLRPEKLNEPIRRKKPTVYFVNSMSDLFHEDIPDDYIDQVFDVIRQSKQHTFQILTKRAERLGLYFSTRHPPENAWLGVSVEDQRYGVPRIAHLRKVNATVRFISVEPLLEALGDLDLSGIHWVIVGGESGPKSRPMAEAWVGEIQMQCARYNSAFFFKQWGNWGVDGIRRTKKANGRLFLNQTWDQMPLILKV